MIHEVTAEEEPEDKKLQL